MYRCGQNKYVSQFVLTGALYSSDAKKRRRIAVYDR